MLSDIQVMEGHKLVILADIIEKYFRMGIGQYIGDFRRDYNVGKTEAHRKRVQEKKIVKERTADKITLKSIKGDNSLFGTWSMQKIPCSNS